jgi:hypothetical protein
VQPKITFGIIVLNGEPFTRYNLRALYPFAHEIIVVEGASRYARHVASPEGHSTDGTLELLRRFQAEEDPEGKLTIVTAEDHGHPDGFWPGEKDEQSRAYASRATGDWLWQIDIDEFYMPEDMAAIRDQILTRPGTQAVSFKQIPFWGSLDWYADGWYLRYDSGREFHRLFRWAPGYTYATHRPPTVVDPRGVDLRRSGWVRASALARRGIFLYHYSLLFPQQASYKSRYYSALFGHRESWAQRSYSTLQDPFKVHNVDRYPSWIERYTGGHPPQAQAMWQDIAAGRFAGTLQVRATDDIARLDASPAYRAARAFLRLVGPLAYYSRWAAVGAIARTPKPVREQLKSMLNQMRGASAPRSRP